MLSAVSRSSNSRSGEQQICTPPRIWSPGFPQVSAELPSKHTLEEFFYSFDLFFVCSSQYAAGGDLQRICPPQFRDVQDKAKRWQFDAIWKDRRHYPAVQNL